MSKKQQSLLLSAPLFGGEFPREREEFFGFACGSCQGNGWHWIENDYGERIKKPCVVCGGSGKIKAVVTIDWQPDGAPSI